MSEVECLSQKSGTNDRQQQVYTFPECDIETPFLGLTGMLMVSGPM